MGIDRVLVAVVLVAPDVVEQVHAREHLARVSGEEIQQIELPRGELDDPTIHPDFALHRVDGQVRRLQPAGVEARISDERVGAPQ